MISRLRLHNRRGEFKTNSLLDQHNKFTTGYYSDPETSDQFSKPESKLTRQSSSDDRNRNYKIPIINITRPRYESDSDSYSSKFGTLDDDVFYGSNGEDKNLNQPKIADSSSVATGNISSGDSTLKVLETHALRRLRILTLKLQKCRMCQQTVYLRGYKCFQCGLIAHRKCIRFLVIRCPKSELPLKIDVFGVDLEESVGVPEVMIKCISEVERRGYNKLKGIYRTTGNPYRVAQICSSFESGPQLIDLRDSNYNDIADVLKFFLDKLPKPLMSPELQSEMIRVAKEWPTRKIPYTKDGVIIIVFELREIVNQLPSTNFNCLSYLMHHLKRISEHQRETDMTAITLAITFSPIIFRQIEPSVSSSQTFNIIQKVRAIELLIINAIDVFGPQPAVNNHLNTDPNRKLV